MRVLVCGSRSYRNEEQMFASLDRFHELYPITVLIEGEQRGADLMARKWAESRGIEVAKFPADWNNLGRKAGPLRNRQMLLEGQPQVVIAFPRGPLSASFGTRDMVGIARRARLRTIVVGVDDIGVVAG